MTGYERLMSRLATIGDKDLDCIEWHLYVRRDGYARVRVNGKSRYVHRIALAWKLGRPVDPDLISLHSCDNRKCYNTNHLREGTFQQNTDDMLDRGNCPLGSAVGNAKLSEDDVRIIRQLLADGETQTDIAAQFNVSQGKVSQIKRRVSWKHV